MSRKTIAITAVTFDALHSVAKYRETMDDVILKAVIAYSRELNIHNTDALQNAVVEYNKRFIDKGEKND